MPLITTDFFVGDIDLPGRSNSGTDEGITDFIKKYEPDFITRVFGYAFGKLFYTNILTPAPEPRMIDIRDGKEYQKGGITYKWQGLIQDLDGFKISPIANWVYLQWRRREATSTGNVGENKPQTANASQQSAVEKTVFARKEMVNSIESFYCFLDANKATYPEWNRRLTDPFLVYYTNSFGI